MSRPRVSRRSLRRSGRVVPAHANQFRGRVIRLRPGKSVAWHSTGPREEMLILLAGSVRLEYQPRRAAVRTMALGEDSCAFLSSGTIHRVVNRSTRNARYVYLTA